MIKRAMLVLFAVSGLAGAANAQDPKAAAASSETKAQPSPVAAAPTPLLVFFETGRSKLRSDDRTVLDQASRAYNEGKPIVMILTGGSDRTGLAGPNLLLSQRRATAVLNGLIERGIPADRFQVLAKGETDLPVPTDRNVPESRNRRVEITWR